jgi:AcrR family transcriptional regulator
MIAPPLTRQARKAATRQALVQAAGELFARHGMEGASLDEIAAHVGLTKGAIYANFRNKEELIDAVGEAFSQVSDGAALNDPAHDIAQRMAALGAELAEMLPHIAPINAVLHLEYDLYLQRHPERVPRERAEYHAWLVEEGRKLDEIARARNEPLPLSGAQLWALLTGAVRGIGFEWMKYPDDIEPDAVAQFFAVLGLGLQAWAREATASSAAATAATSPSEH